MVGLSVCEIRHGGGTGACHSDVPGLVQLFVVELDGSLQLEHLERQLVPRDLERGPPCLLELAGLEERLRVVQLVAHHLRELLDQVRVVLRRLGKLADLVLAVSQQR